jgi:hypothetical protein
VLDAGMFAKGKKHGSLLIPSLHFARMTSQEQGFHDFAAFAAKLKGDEKSEAQTFLFHLLEAFNHDPTRCPKIPPLSIASVFPANAPSSPISSGRAAC